MVTGSAAAIPADDYGPGEDFRPVLSEVETVALHELLPADSPRSSGEDLQHIRLLHELDTELPPIIVHRPTMRIMDGMHRLRAAALRGDTTIRVRFFDGDEADAFVIAVRENTAHGLPLSARDRAAAAERIVRSHPHWSDRMIAKIVGLSARRVREIRRAALPDTDQPGIRLGRDGRVRPLDSSLGRIRAAELITSTPQASLRQIAKQAGVSPSTVRDVRDRLNQGEDPLPTSLRAVGTPPRPRPRRAAPADAAQRVHPDPGPAARPTPDRHQASPLDILIRDPSLRCAEHGRLLLRLLSVGARLASSRELLLDAVPEHCRGLVVQAARESAAAWTEFADDLLRRGAGATEPVTPERRPSAARPRR